MSQRMDPFLVDAKKDHEDPINYDDCVDAVDKVKKGIQTTPLQVGLDHH